MGFQVAIDGPSGAGKSTVARITAQKTGFVYIDTGAMYRAVALYVFRLGIDRDDEEAVCAVLPDIYMRITYIDGFQRLFLNDEDVTEDLRTAEVSAFASAVARFSAVREKLVCLQRGLAEDSDVVMDGRDIGTYVLCRADVKIYLDATVEARTARRVSELASAGREADFDTVREEIIKRDYNDTNRDVSPLRRADDAVYIDTSEMTAEEAALRICDMISERYARNK